MESHRQRSGVAGAAHARLRDATIRVHGLLERDLLINSVDPSEDDRRRFLAALYGWLEPTGARLWTHGWSSASEPGLRARKYDWLRRDLEANGIACARLPMARQSLVVCDPWARIGLAYVHEGSLLGGLVLKHRWQGVGSPLAASRYLTGYGLRQPDLWRSFLAEIEALCADSPDGLERSCDHAVAAFGSLHEWFREQGVTRLRGSR